MKKILLVCCLFATFLACKKETNTRVGTVYGQAIDSMRLSYNHTYLFFFERTSGSVTTLDSDRVLFRSNGTISEVANHYDLLSHTYPDTINYAVNTSFDNDITLYQVPKASVFTFFPLHEARSGYLLHDFLITDVVSVYRSKDNDKANNLFKVIHASQDSNSVVTGYIKKL